MTIKEKYELSLVKIEKLKNILKEEEKESKNLKNTLYRTNIFKVMDIGKILEQLLCEVTSEKFTFEDCAGTETVTRFNYCDKWQEKENVIKFYIIKDGSSINPRKPLDYTCFETGEFFLLHSISIAASLENVMFMNMSTYDKTTLPLEVNFISDFIIKIKQYRVDNDLVDITYEEMKIFLDNYLNDNLNNLQEHYKKNKPRIIYLKK